MTIKNRNYPSYICESSIKNLEISYEAPLRRKAEYLKNREPITHSEFVENHGKLKWSKTNPFGVTLHRHTTLTYQTAPAEWPYNQEIVYERFINLINSKEPKIVAFWKKLHTAPEAQSRFITGLSYAIKMWAFGKERYEGSTSKVIRKQEDVVHDLKKILVKLRDSPYVSGKADDEVTKALDARYTAVFEEEDAAPLWNLWDDEPLGFDNLIESIITRLEEGSKNQIFPSWYPSKINSKSADKVFVVRLLQRLMNQHSIKYTHPLIGEIASVILEETISDDDVRKNLLETTA